MNINLSRVLIAGVMLPLSLSVYAYQDDLDNNPNKIIWCSTEGNDNDADGTEAKPFYNLQLAVNMAKPGDRIYMKAGTYYYNDRIMIDNREDFIPDENNYTEIWGYEGQAILDFSRMPGHDYHSRNIYRGIRLTSSYWHLKNLDICNASDNGLIIERKVIDMDKGDAEYSAIVGNTMEAHDNIIEMCNFYRNGDTGLQIMNLGAYNKIINCDSYFNCDIEHGDADGFAPKISIGTGNYFYGCRAWMNSDDGWDSFYKTDGGFPDDMTVILENCVTYKNGYLENGRLSDGNRNGFKMGSANGAVNQYLIRCVSVGHPAKGFDQNHNWGDINLINCTAYNNGTNYGIMENPSSGHSINIINSISIDRNEGLGIMAPASNFEDLTNADELIGPRDEYGNLPATTFAHLKEDSNLIDAGQMVTTTLYRGVPVNALSYYGNAPDLGAYEYKPDVPTDVKEVIEESGEKSLSLFQAANGMLFITVREPGMNGYKAYFYDMEGRMLAIHEFMGSTTGCRVPENAHGIVTLLVEGDNGYRGSAKIRLK